MNLEWLPSGLFLLVQSQTKPFVCSGHNFKIVHFLFLVVLWFVARSCKAGYSSEVNDPIRNGPRPGRRFVVELQFFSFQNEVVFAPLLFGKQFASHSDSTMEPTLVDGIFLLGGVHHVSVCFRRG